jgi:hypothetical protein
MLISPALLFYFGVFVVPPLGVGRWNLKETST